MKYLKHINNEPIPSNMRLVNVCICVTHNEEFLLGNRCSSCSTFVRRSSYVMRKQSTLIYNNERKK
jgi:hypothetical protein